MPVWSLEKVVDEAHEHPGDCGEALSGDVAVAAVGQAAAAVAWSSLSAAYLSESWDSVSPALERVSRLQLDAATRGAGYGEAADQGLYEAPEACDPSSLAGVSSRGASLWCGPVFRYPTHEGPDCWRDAGACGAGSWP